MSLAISLKDVCFSYDSDVPVLNIESLSVDCGEKVFINGPSGSGKSTLLNIISGVLSPTSGELSILEHNPNKLSNGDKDKLRGDNIGFVFQSFNLIPYLTIYENILLPIKASKIKRLKVANKLDEEINRISTHLKIKDFLHKRVTELSIGQQQRVAVARALIGDPEIIIADEPTSSLDEDVTDSFMKLLIEEHEKKKFTLVFVSHDRRLAKYFDREIALLDINNGVKKND